MSVENQILSAPEEPVGIADDVKSAVAESAPAAEAAAEPTNAAQAGAQPVPAAENNETEAVAAAETEPTAAAETAVGDGQTDGDAATG